MPIDESLLQVREYTGQGYAPVIDYDTWLVAILNYADELLPHNITHMQRHDKTDEVFVLLRGRCILFIGEGDETVTSIFAQDMEPLKMYNVKRSVWHMHTLSEDAMVLVVENLDTTVQNSPTCPLDDSQRNKLIELSRVLWEGKSNG
ncbi:MAG: hypothetical protein GY832_43905 [Chloroflexi bacterium]|nr:hypothetical protein [Chloroflexota bacterium]